METTWEWKVEDKMQFPHITWDLLIVIFDTLKKKKMMEVVVVMGVKKIRPFWEGKS